MTAFSGRLSDVDIRLLRIFSTIADCGGVSGAAFALNVDRSTISRQLTELETRLGLRLCERSRAGFWLTNEGRVILDRAQDLLGAINEFSQHVSEIHREIAGELVIGVADTTLHHPKYLLPTALKSFQADAPRVDVDLKVMAIDDITAGLLNRSCHVGYMPAFARRPELHYENLYTEKNILHCGSLHPIYESKQVNLPLAELKAFPIVTLAHESGGAAQIQKLNLTRGPVTNADEGVATLILTGAFLGYLHEDFGQIFVRQGKMAQVMTPRTAYPVDTCAVTLASKRRSALIELFMSHLKSAGQQPSGGLAAMQHI